MKLNFTLSPNALVLMLFLLGCGPSDNQGTTPDQGGDHVPELKVYASTALHRRSHDRGMGATQPHSSDLQPLAYFGRRYHLCLDADAFTENMAGQIDQLLQSRPTEIGKAGLVAIVNRVLSDVRRFSPDAATFSDRIEIVVARVADSDNNQTLWQCDALLIDAGLQEFPFTHEDFSGRAVAWFFPTQLRRSDGVSNQIPVGIVSRANTEAKVSHLVQLLTTRLLGLAPSEERASFLNETDVTTAESSVLSESFDWAVYDSQGFPKPTDDARTFAAFALQFLKVVKPADRDRLQLFEDMRSNLFGEADRSLVIPAGSTPSAFRTLFGNQWLSGFRDIGSPTNVCWSLADGIDLDDSQKRALLSFSGRDDADRLVPLLASRNASVDGSTIIAQDHCHVLIAVRKRDQFPFADSKINGIYFHEGSVKGQNGSPNRIPVIYLNASDLDLVPTPSTNERRYAGIVLEHEWAHFLGMRHSESMTSVLYPIGSNEAWDVSGYDGSLFDEYLAHLL